MSLNQAELDLITKKIKSQMNSKPGNANQFRNMRFDNQEQIFRHEVVCSNKDEDERNPIGIYPTIAT